MLCLEVIFMELISALNPIRTNKIEELILKLKNYLNIEIVTHNIQQARRISEKVAFMYLDELIEFDSIDTIFNHLKNELTQRYIAGYIGYKKIS
jgi:phosphate transport system ATP-binding protein